MASAQQHVCFYSKVCPWSKRFIKAASETPFINEIHFICVDKGPDGSRPKLPGWLKKVPTLVVSGENEPRTDEQVINWLSERQLRNTGGSAPGMPGSGAPPAQGEIVEWNPLEMDGKFTKGYSMIGTGDDYEAPMGNFQFLNGAGAMSTKTASDMPGGGLGARGQQKTRKEDLFDKEMERYIMNRNAGMPPPVMRQ